MYVHCRSFKFDSRLAANYIPVRVPVPYELFCQSFATALQKKKVQYICIGQHIEQMIHHVAVINRSSILYVA